MSRHVTQLGFKLATDKSVSITARPFALSGEIYSCEEKLLTYGSIFVQKRAVHGAHYDHLVSIYNTFVMTAHSECTDAPSRGCDSTRRRSNGEYFLPSKHAGGVNHKCRRWRYRKFRNGA